MIRRCKFPYTPDETFEFGETVETDEDGIKTVDTDKAEFLL